jgi:class 3 adenylate cyclase/TolB-like protein/tetratricopeptide (TPR) repeat protein
MSTASTRRLAAVLIADVAGYSRLMEVDEAGTHARLLEIRAEVTDRAVRRHGGRIVRTVGDGLLVEFPSAMSALVAAIEIQRAMAERNRGLPTASRIDHRIGINLGDILIEENDIAGNGVNVAARLEAIAPPGGIAISGSVRNQVRQDLGVAFVDAGRQQVKNIAQTVRVFRVELDGRPSLFARLRARVSARRVAAAAGVLALAIALGFGYPRGRPVDKPPQSLAVLPFAYPAEVPGAATLAASLTAQFTGAVSRVDGLTVVAPSVAAQLAGHRGEVHRIGRELKVRYLVDGRIEQSGNVARVTANLIDTDSGSTLWSREIDSPAAADNTAPLALVGPLAETLRSAVRAAELQRIEARSEDSAYALALSASDALQKSTEPKELPNIRERFERALRIDPQHVPALIGYAHTLLYQTNPLTPGPQREALLTTAAEVSLRAVTLQPDNAEAWAARANALLFSGQLDAAAEATQRGISLNPYLYLLQSFGGQVLLAQGHAEQALAAFDRGIELNPSSMGRGVLMHFRCRALLLLGRYAAATEACERGIAFGPEWPDYMVLTAAYALLGDQARAAQAKASLMRLQPGFSIRWHEAVAARGDGSSSRFDELLHAGLRKAGVAEE